MCVFPFDAAFCFFFLFFAFPGSDITAPKGVIESNEQNFRLLENVVERRGGEARRDELILQGAISGRRREQLRKQEKADEMGQAGGV